MQGRTVVKVPGYPTYLAIWCWGEWGPGAKSAEALLGPWQQRLPLNPWATRGHQVKLMKTTVLKFVRNQDHPTNRPCLTHSTGGEASARSAAMACTPAGLGGGGGCSTARALHEPF